MKNFIITFAAFATVVAMSSCTVEDQILPVSETQLEQQEDGIQNFEAQEEVSGHVEKEEASAQKNEYLNELETSDPEVGQSSNRISSQDETGLNDRTQTAYRTSEEQEFNKVSIRIAPMVNKKTTN